MMIALPNELELVMRAETDSSAFAVIYDHYFPRIYTYVRCRVSNSYVADELTSQIFERLLTRLGSYRAERGNFCNWLFTIAHNIVADYFRDQKRRGWISLEVMSEVACAEDKPEETVIANESRSQLLAALRQLNDQERSILALKFTAEMTNRRIAQITGLSESNVGVIVFRAIRRLRTILGPEGEFKHG